MISFEIDGSADDADDVCGALRLIRNATSLGGVESTIERRAKLAGQTHLPPTLLRLAVGIEDVDDLEADLDDHARLVIRPTATGEALFVPQIPAPTGVASPSLDIDVREHDMGAQWLEERTAM